MSRDLPSALGLGLPSANGGLFVVGWADCLSECVYTVFSQGPYQGWLSRQEVLFLSVLLPQADLYFT